MQVGVIGINHKLADLLLREKLAKACQKYFSALHTAYDNQYFILLSTCNRTEIYFYSQDLANTHIHILSILRREVEEEFDHKLYSYFGIDCFHHLARVTLGLDSAIIAETEIQRQVKFAYENVSEHFRLPEDFHFLFQKSLRIAKKLRFELQLGHGMPNLEHAILQIGKYIFPIPEKTRLLFVGASNINKKILLFLKNKKFQNITICNRSSDQAQMLAEQYHIQHLAWSQLPDWYEYDWIIFGTKSPNYLVTQHKVTEPPKPTHKLVMDLCVPRNVDPLLGRNPQITLLNIDQMNRVLQIRSRRMIHLIKKAERLVACTTYEYAARYAAKTCAKIPLVAINA